MKTLTTIKASKVSGNHFLSRKIDITSERYFISLLRSSIINGAIILMNVQIFLMILHVKSHILL